MLKNGKQQRQRMWRNPTGAMEVTRLSYLAATDVDTVYGDLNTRRSGLTPEEVEASRERHGDNSLSERQRASAPIRFLKAFGDPFVLILVVIGVVSLATDVVLAAPGEADPATPILIFGMALVSVSLRFVQESRGEEGARALAKSIATHCCVERAGAGRHEVPLDEVVVGDICHLAAGDMVPADLRIVAARDLFIGQSALTGESEPVEKRPAATDGMVAPLASPNLAFLGTSVISGTGIGVAVRVGDETELGSIAAHLEATDKETAYDRGIRDVSLLLARLMLIVVPIVFAVCAITKGDWLDALLFSLSVAVGLTPEMLPMIVTSCLARGAHELSQGNVIVKRLDAIQNLGSVDVLCCDKTGTLTEDRVVLERHLDVTGATNPEVLRQAFLNSHFETGMLNLIDTAIIAAAHAELGLDDEALVADHFLVDELPFDYERRRVSVVVGDAAGHTTMVCKGALEEVLGCCETVMLDERTVALTDEVETRVLERGRALSAEGMRVLGVAVKDEPAGVGSLSAADERDMVFIGYLAFLDPPKEEAADAVRALAAHGVATKILTGDSGRVATYVCERLGLEVAGTLEGADIERMGEGELEGAVEDATIFAKLAPAQKARVVEALKARGHVVGFMGDGVNDAAMRSSDCGISVDTGADVAKEAADIILLEKDLRILERGVECGRRTFQNMSKYVKMTASSNFGNVFSVLVASAFLPFLPMSAAQLLFLNFVYDLTCTSMPADNVDDEAISAPKRWDSASISTFMRWFGPVSSVFDIVTFAVLFFVVCPAAAGATWAGIADEGARSLFVGTFQASWLLESMVTQVTAIHLLRTDKRPIIESHAAWQISVLGILGIALIACMCTTRAGAMLDLAMLTPSTIGIIALISASYAVTLLIVRRAYKARHGELI